MSEITILICDDNPVIPISLKGYFDEEHMTTLSANTGEEALKIFDAQKIDLAILDVMLPGMNGREVCREIRKISDIPIIMLSAKGEEMDRILGLEIGADDYVTKPFSPREVVIRAKKLLMRRNTNLASRQYNVGSLVLIPDSYDVRIDDVKIRLTAKEFDVLKYLMAHKGMTMTREHILNAVWGSDYLGESRMIDTSIRRLRQKLFADADPEKVNFDIITVFGIGYKIEEK